MAREYSEEDDARADYEAEMARDDFMAVKDFSTFVPWSQNRSPIGPGLRWSNLSADEKARQDGFPNAGGWG